VDCMLSLMILFAFVSADCESTPCTINNTNSCPTHISILLQDMKGEKTMDSGSRRILT
jgi:hypothetical protein